MTALPFDELSDMARRTIGDIFEKHGITKDLSEANEDVSEELEDEIEDLLIMAYVFGNNDTNKELSSDVETNSEKLVSALDLKIDGKTYANRVSDSKTVDDIYRIADTEIHRMYNAGKYDTAEDYEHDVYKIWHTQEDPLVRLTHDYIDRVKVEQKALFYTLGGDSAPYPGAFTLPSNNINCRCWIEYTKAISE